MTLTFDLLTPKSIGFFYSIRAITLWSLKALGQRVLELLSGNGFHSSGHRDLDLWPTDPKINRGLQLNKGYHPMKFEGSGSKGTRVIERKRSVTDGQTDKAKTICLPQRGGDIIFNVPILKCISQTLIILFLLQLLNSLSKNFEGTRYFKIPDEILRNLEDSDKPLSSLHT